MTDARYLPAIENNFLIDNEELAPLLLGGRATPEQITTMCDNFRRAAIASLLRTGRSRLFRLRLQRSGAAYAYYLGRAHPGDLKLSDAKPLVDAIGAGDNETAMAIARLSRHDWVQDEEYEENFLFYEFVMQLALLGASDDSLAALLERWQACLAGTTDRRLDVCRALLQGESDAFDEALGAYLDERDQEYDEQGDLIESEILLTEREVSVEALAFVRLARSRGIETQSGYRRVPEPTLANESIVWPSQSFTLLD